MNRRKTKEEFIEQAKKIHGNKYDYSKTEYINAKTKVCIICPKHGEFWQIPYHHISRKLGCNLCSKPIHDTITFITEAKEIHGDKYDYSQVEYVNGNTKVKIICSIHGEFWQNPHNHLNGQGCPKCSGFYQTTEQFIEKARKIHGDKYDYSKTNYEKSHTKVCIICPKHGEFWQTPHNHLKGKGCAYCKESKLEIEVENILSKNNIPHIRQCKKSTLNWLGKLSLDFYLPEHNIAIECQGIQHFANDHFFESLEVVQERDEKKMKLCEENGIKILYYSNLIFEMPYKIITNEEDLIKAIENENT
jgi:very-short-patch-repair endonuclease